MPENTVICFPWTFFLATQGSEGLISNVTLSKSTTSILINSSAKFRYPFSDFCRLTYSSSVSVNDIIFHGKDLMEYLDKIEFEYNFN